MTYKQSLTGVMILFLALNFFAVGARFYVRMFLVKAFGWDDIFIGLAYLGWIFASVFGFMGLHYGFMHENWEDEAWYDYDKTVKYYFMNQLFLYVSSGIIKIGVALVLYRLATNVRNQAMLVTAICIVVVWTCITTIFSMDMCAITGSADYAGSGVCNGVGYFRMISNIFLDYFFALYPIPMLWRSTLSPRMKVIVCGLLSLGIVASAATIAKLVVLVKLNTATELYQQTWLHYQLLIWADAELGLSTFCASVAALRPLLRVCMGRSLTNMATADGRTPEPEGNRGGSGGGGGSGDGCARQAFSRRHVVHHHHQGGGGGCGCDADQGARPDDFFELASVDTCLVKEDRKVQDEEQQQHAPCVCGGVTKHDAPSPAA